MSVFVDTSALYALLVRTEDGHGKVSAAFGELLADGRPLLTTNYVMLESVALLQYRLGLKPVRDLEASLAPLMTQRWIGESLHRRAVERLLRTDRKKLSLVDCTSFVVMEDEGISEALALNHDFVSEGFSLIPGS